MPTRTKPRAPTGLSGDDVVTLRAAVEAGRRPRVVFTDSAGQVAGQTGQVVRLDDPTSAEWVVVRVAGDELPFAPSDVLLSTRARSPRAPSADGPAAAATPKAAGAREATGTREAAGTPKAVGTPKVVGTPDAAPATRAAAVLDGPTWTPAVPAPPTPKEPAVPDPAVAEAARPRAAAAKRPPRRPAELTVTLTCTDGQWSVSAARGARTVAKPAPVRPAEALRMVGLLDSPAVREAVDEIVTAARVEAEQHAERLRRELAEVEASLAGFGAAD